MRLLSFIIYICISFNLLAANKSLYDLFPTPLQNINGVNYPQNGKILYSGSFKKRISSGQAVNAMLGSNTVYFQSKTFNNITSCLQKKSDTCSKEIISYWDPLLLGKETRRRNYLVSQVNNSRRRNGGRYVDYTKAQEAAVVIMDSYFSWLGKYQLLNNFIKYKFTILNGKAKKSNGQDISWPSELVYSSLQSYTSALYGPRTVIFKDKVKRSLDIGYWNFINSGYWYNTQRDMGEFITAGYVPGKDIEGYQIRLKMGGTFKPSKSGFGKRWSPEFHQIEYAFYKDKIEGIDVVLVFSGDLHACIIKSKSLEYSYCTDPTFDLVKPGKINDDKYKNNAVKRNAILAKIKLDPNRFPNINRYRKAKLLGYYTLSNVTTLPTRIKQYYPQLPMTKREARKFQKRVNKANLMDIKFHPIRLIK